MRAECAVADKRQVHRADSSQSHLATLRSDFSKQSKRVPASPISTEQIYKIENLHIFYRHTQHPLQPHLIPHPSRKLHIPQLRSALHGPPPLPSDLGLPLPKHLEDHLLLPAQGAGVQAAENARAEVEPCGAGEGEVARHFEVERLVVDE